MIQANLFGDKASERAADVGRELVQELHAFARHRGVPRPTIAVWGVHMYGNAFTVDLSIDGKRLAVVNRTDVGAAARDLWEQFDGSAR